MLRDYFMNKWVLGGIGYLIVFSVACVLWYQYDIADERKAAVDTEELLRQSGLSHQETKESEMSSVVGQAIDITIAESTPPNAKKSITETTIKTEYSGLSDAREKQPEQTQETTEVVRVSPYGFGQYPEVPSDYPTDVIWNQPEAKENLPDHALKGIGTVRFGFLLSYGLKETKTSGVDVLIMVKFILTTIILFMFVMHNRKCLMGQLGGTLPVPSQLLMLNTPKKIFCPLPFLVTFV